MSARYSKQSGYTVLKRQQNARATVRSNTSKFKLGPTAAKFVGIGVIAIMIGLFTSRNIADTQDAYEESRLRKAGTEAQVSIDAMQFNVDRAKALETISTSPVKEGMVPSGAAEFVPAETGEVAGASTTR